MTEAAGVVVGFVSAVDASAAANEKLPVDVAGLVELSPIAVIENGRVLSPSPKLGAEAVASPPPPKFSENGAGFAVSPPKFSENPDPNPEKVDEAVPNDAAVVVTGDEPNPPNTEALVVAGDFVVLTSAAGCDATPNGLADPKENPFEVSPPAKKAPKLGAPGGALMVTTGDSSFFSEGLKVNEALSLVVGGLFSSCFFSTTFDCSFCPDDTLFDKGIENVAVTATFALEIVDGGLVTGSAGFCVDGAMNNLGFGAFIAASSRFLSELTTNGADESPNDGFPLAELTPNDKP